MILLSVSLATVLHRQILRLTQVRVYLFPQPIKAPESVATIITSESVFYKVCSPTNEKPKFLS